ncbi:MULTISPECIES: glycosyltransferase [unclassified Exiguobacterium]|uniref:glycosyltransferase n=1 Tax=unclassified Exiguobacterium TaxID=2644629 RepID=UPI001BEBEF0B|nr:MULTISPECIES: glycosyltransferase [unclassified Exiguobacterium]
MEIIIYSKSLDVMNRSHANTSSKIFEIEFAQSLAQHAKVSVVSYCAKSDMDYKNVRLFSLERDKTIADAIESTIIKKSLFKESQKVIIAFGYDLKVFKQLKKLSKLYNSKLVSYTFDTHKGVTSSSSFLKKNLINLYFQFGIRYLNNIDGIILFNKEAYKEMKLKIPFLVSKVGINKESIVPDVYLRKSNEKFKVVYTGTLIEYNSIETLIKTMSYLEGQNIFLDIYGNGPLKSYVEDHARKSTNITYHGLVSNSQINSAISKADLLINLRDTENYISKFAFPSKMIQYMASGIPVLTTNVLKEKEFCEATFTIDDLNPKKVMSLIIYIKNNPLLQTKKSEYAKEYIKENFLWSNIIGDVIQFLDFDCNRQ